MKDLTSPLSKFCLIPLVAILSAQNLSASVISSITSGFNGTSIADTSTVWFNSHITGVSGDTPPTTLYFLGQQISIVTQSSGTLVYNLPDSQIIITGSGSTTPSTSFNVGQNRWITTVGNDNDDPFLSGFALDVPTGVELKSSTVTWSGTFYTDLFDLPLSGAWQWSAAVYTNFSTDYNALGVTPVDGFNGFSQSGSPGAFEDFVTGGARGGGGSNFTGSNSGTGSFVAAAVPEPSSLLFVLSAAVSGILIRRRANA